MINYTLNFIEDLKEEILTRNIICLGTPTNIEELLKVLGIPRQQVEFCCNIHSDSVSNYPFMVREVSVIDSINPSEYVLLITDQDIDLAKRLLSCLSISNIKEVINCYKFPLNTRYYNSSEQLLIHRYSKPLEYWKRYCMDKTKNCDMAAVNFSNKRMIPRVILVLTTKCNLRCRDCIALTPHYQSGYHVDLHTLLQSVDSFLSNVDECYCLELLGGEPFLYPFIDNLLKLLIDNKKIFTIQITTNGLVTVKDSTIELMKNPKIHIRISDYNIQSKNKYLLQEKLLSSGVNFWVQSDIAWLPIGTIQKRNAQRRVIMDEYSLCFEGLNCKTILNGKLYNCTFASRIYDLKLAPNVENIDLLSGNVSWEKLLTFWTSPYSKACDYCQIMNPNAKCIPSAIQDNN